MGNRIILALGIVLLSVSALIFNCAPESLKGILVENELPIISFSNIPWEDSTFSSSAVVSWYGIDSDGLIIAYYYKVVLADSIPGAPDDDSVAYYADFVLTDTTLISLDEWIMTDSSSCTVQLFASEDTTEILRQYIFIRCQDDAGDFSEIIYFNLFRANHIPQTILGLLPGNYIETIGDEEYIYTEPVWSLPDTTELWSGFSISWEGQDTLDFPEGPPDFQYEWKLYGPYDTAYYDADNDTILFSIDDVSEDSIYFMSCGSNDYGFVYGADAASCDDPWVWSKGETATALPTGVYLFSVRVRDDANVPDPTVAWGTFICIVPEFITNPDLTNDVLIIRATQYRSGIGSQGGWPYEDVIVGDDTLNFPTLVMGFYSQMIDSAENNYTYTIYGDSAIGGSNAAVDIPPMSVLSTHKMVIIDDMDYLGIDLGSAISDPLVNVLEDYLSVGGKAWVIGRQSFMTQVGNNSGHYDFEPASLAVDFFDLSSAFYAEMDFDGFDEDEGIFTKVEFIQATSVYTGYEDLPTDSAQTVQLLQNGLNKVEAFVRNTARSRTLFTYEAAQPDTMTDFQYKPVALRFEPEHGLFKTSYFSFPLYMMDNSNGDVQTVFTDMLSWFLTED